MNASASATGFAYPGRERMLEYGNADKAEKIQRQLEILEEEAEARIDAFDKATEEGAWCCSCNARMLT